MDSHVTCYYTRFTQFAVKTYLVSFREHTPGHRIGKVCTYVYLPVRVEDLAESEFAAHPQVGLMLCEVRGGTARRVDLTVLIRLIQSFNELT